MPSTGHPALCVPASDGSNTQEFQIIWGDASDGANGGIKVASAPSFEFQNFTRTHELWAEQAYTTVSGTQFRGGCYIAWMGVGPNANRPNIARYTPGEVVTYGVGGH